MWKICPRQTNCMSCVDKCVCVCVVDYETGSVEKRLEAEESEDTDCDGSSLPDDSPEVQENQISSAQHFQHEGINNKT